MEDTPQAADWDRYWKGTWDAAAHEDGSPQDKALSSFWQDFFASIKPAEHARLIDIAAGNGAVARYARPALPDSGEYLALDYSHSALLNLAQRYPDVLNVAADASQPPCTAGSFDILISQYGIEYAGPRAIIEAGKLLRPGGHMALVLHLRDGVIYTECAANLRALLAVQQLRLPTLAREAFCAGYGLNAGRGSVQAFKAAEAAFTPAVRGLEMVMKEEGAQIAGGLPRQLYQDIATMYRRMSAYEESDVMKWLDGMEPELEAYIGRMQSMLNAALDETALKRHCEELHSQGFDDIRTDRLLIGEGAGPAAWTLIAGRS